MSRTWYCPTNVDQCSYLIVLIIVEQQDLNLANNILLDNFNRICSRRYQENIHISRPDDDQKRQIIDLRRAYSLIQWRCIYKVAAMGLLDPNLYPSIRQSLLDEELQRGDDVSFEEDEVLASTLRNELDHRHRQCKCLFHIEWLALSHLLSCA